MRFPGFEEEWESKKLGDLLGFKVTNSFSRENLNYEIGTVKNIHYGDIHTKFQTLFDITNEVVPFINEEINITRISAENYCKKGDIIFADASEDLKDVGKSIEVINLNGEKLLSGLHTLLARPKENIFHLGFNGYLFKTNQVRTQIQKESQGTKVLSINVGRISKIELSIPTEQEQKRITSLMSLIDKRINTQNKIIEELKLLKNTLSKKIFSGQLKFKDESGNDFPEWRMKEVGEIFKITRGNVLAMNLLTNNWSEETPYPVYSSQTKIKGLAGYYNKFLFENAITWTTDGANAGNVNYRSGKFYCTNVCGVLLNKEGFANICVSELINSVSKNYVSYVGNPKLMNGIMSKIKIEFPSLQEQAKIANFLSSIDTKIDVEYQFLQELKEQKKYLLANLFI